MYDKIANVLKILLPSGAYLFLRRLAAALLTPLIFSIKKGHFKSALAGVSLTPEGEPIPWLSYPAIEFLQKINLKGIKVLEFGAGQSTLWFSNRGAQVTSLEINKDWYERILKLHPDGNFNLVDPGFTNLPKAVTDAKYEIIVIDGGDRLKACEIALELLVEKGILIHDNSDHEKFTGHLEIPELLFQKGFRRVDFYGFAPVVIREQCTSIYWKDDEFFLSSKPPNRFALSTGHWSA